MNECEYGCLPDGTDCARPATHVVRWADGSALDVCWGHAAVMAADRSVDRAGYLVGVG